MILTDIEKQTILKEFPISISELSYEVMAHKKVQDADIMVAIPEGKKCLAWFTCHNQNDVCFILELDENNAIKNIEIIQTSFNFKLTFGTILQGIYFKWKQTNCFTIDDIYLYKGKNVSKINFNDKLILINTILTNDISQLAIHSNYTIFGFPLISNNFQNLILEIEQLPYKINTIKFKYFSSKKGLFIKYYKPGSQTNIINNNQVTNNLINKQLVFKVTPDIQNDIYNLLVYNNGKEEFYNVAFIPDYKTSIMMNKLFRNIKENDYLDSLEESDNEDEFENENIDKYVYLDKNYKMFCEYNSKFNKWVPIKVAENKSEKIVTLNILRNNTQEYLNKLNNNHRQHNNYNKTTHIKYNSNNNNNYNNNSNIKSTSYRDTHYYKKNINNIYNVSNKSR